MIKRAELTSLVASTGNRVMPPLLLEEGIAFKPDGGRSAFHPSLNILSEREWFVTFDVGTSSESLDYQTQGLRTTDGGRSWCVEPALVDKGNVGPTTHTIRTRHFGGGRILGLGKWEDRQGYETQRSNRETLGQVPMKLFWIESLDGGHHWSPPRWIDPPLVGPTWELCHAPVQLPGNHIAAPVATWRGWNGELPNGEVSGLLVSSDGGATWPTFVPTFDGRTDGVIHWEQSVIVRGNGGLLATAWAYDPRTKETKPSPYCESQDGGQSFGPARSTGFFAQTCKVLELRSGKIVAAYRRHDRPGLWADLATVDKEGWRTEGRALLWCGAVSGMAGTRSSSEELNTLRFGYPSLAELTDGSVLVVFWGSTGGPSSIRWLRFHPDRLDPIP